MFIVTQFGWRGVVFVLGVSVFTPPALMADELPPGLALHFDFDGANEDGVPNLRGEVGAGKVWEARFVPVEGIGKVLAMRQDDEKKHFVDVKDHPALNRSAFTVAAWVCPRRVDISGAYVCKHDWLDGGGRGFTLRSSVINTVNFTVGAGGWISVNSETLLEPNTWIHAVGTFDGKTLRMYCNGKLEDATEAPKEYNPSPYGLRIGHGTYALERHRKFDGKIDDVMVWDRCLSAEEAKAVFDATKVGRPAPVTEEDILRVVRKLGSENYADRVAAQMALVDLGPSVLPLLERQEGGEDKEIKMRAGKLMRKLGEEK